MTKLEDIYPAAIEQTKQKLIEDVDNYLEKNETIPSYMEYIEERRQFIEQIWINVWINKASNDVPKKEKKQFLKNKGYETEGVDKKIINKLFRDEIRNEKSFNAIQWLDSKFAEDREGWEKKAYRAQEAYLARQAKAEVEKEQNAFVFEFQKWFENYLEKNFVLFYLYVRYYAAKQVSRDLQKNPKYKYVEPFRLEEKLVVDGKFNQDDYRTAADFFNELTGGVQASYDWGQRSFEYETYYDFYEQAILEYMYKLIPKKVTDNLPQNLNAKYKELFQQNFSGARIVEWFDDECLDLTEKIIQELEIEYLDDLLKLVDIPFDESKHREIYETDVAERERKKAEELAELERKKAEEERIMDDIFGKAYIPSVGSNLRYVLHIGETNTGKTHHALKKMKAAESGLYLAPLRLLALEVFDKLNGEGVLCSLKTGEEEKLVEGATHISSTVEMFHEKDFYEVVVIDEAQMLADKDRGFSWYRAITKANAREVHIIGSWNIKDMLFNLLEGVELEIHEYSRDTPLEVENKEFELKHTKKGDALICFSRKRVLETAAKLKRSGHSVSMIYGSMPPETRKKQIELFNSGQTKVVVATDAIGMGLNLPIRRIVFLETEKFDGTRRRRLTSQEVKQIAGRAGRKGIYDIGKVAFTADIKHMNRLLEQMDNPVETFAIAPTSTVFERFQHYYRDLGTFFELWEKFNSPKGTKKASLTEEQDLYELIRGTPIEARFSMMDLYGFLHLPFSKKEPGLVRQWLDTMMAITDETEIPEPIIKRKGLEDFELSYKAIGLHLLFLYRMGRRTEAVYWERVRTEISDEVHDSLRDEVENFRKKCKRCGKPLPEDSSFPICDPCFHGKFRRENRGRRRRA
ncbi:ATP-dependent RNA helicase SUPV3L1/SUV3 [Mesobacillus persicus]|uniref:ATP-dependent RNA helicase SUPV3L1/SUV3 n=1 Tax=Mesobacillus persicus TaxID=930146 RepID=A0A1H7VVS6_9BACI|nr:DEAD/DEAH box helicase [Mesobacillus persicus]SEM13336.1 ATP-dependent RNA helicase SUPV3L1/SUV3 [Mesobacillus persicus]